MPVTEDRRARDDHDWHSLGYVDQWIAKDVGREDERRPVLDKMMSFAGFARRCPAACPGYRGGIRRRDRRRHDRRSRGPRSPCKTSLNRCSIARANIFRRAFRPANMFAATSRTPLEPGRRRALRSGRIGHRHTQPRRFCHDQPMLPRRQRSDGGWRLLPQLRLFCQCRRRGGASAGAARRRLHFRRMSLAG